MTEPKKTGRPKSYTEELADEVCRLVSEGSNLNKIAKTEGFPSRQTIYTWFREHKSFLDNYTRAREERADARADRIDDIVERVGKKELDPNAARVMIDAEKWQAGKENAARYGDKSRHELTGKDGAPVESKMIVEFVDAPANK